jgi:Kef-type K+ transport system membrane component KefB
MPHSEGLLFNVLLQLIVMIAAARAGNQLMRHLGQPGVIGEVIAGFVLGPSLFGDFLPGTSRSLFGVGASTPITMISQIGLVLLMFQIGAGFEFGHLKRRGNRGRTMVVAAASIAVPWVLGFGIGELSASALAPHINPVVYSLCCGIGLAVVAVPVLGRILQEFDLMHTEIGVVAISIAALSDVTGWVLLAAISAYASATLSARGVAIQVSGILLLGIGAWVALRPLVRWLLKKVPMERGELPPNILAVTICGIFMMGLLTYTLGIFTIFGAFLAGMLVHNNRSVVDAWRAQVGRFVLIFFLPVFFTYTGLRTNVLGLAGASDWMWLSVILLAAVLGKPIPVYIASRACGFVHRECAILGALLNTRGLTELIVLNLGYELGFIPQRVFTMLVVTAVLATVMTGPLLRVLLPRAGYLIPHHVEA